MKKRDLDDVLLVITSIVGILAMSFLVGDSEDIIGSTQPTVWSLLFIIVFVLSSVFVSNIIAFKNPFKFSKAKYSVGSIVWIKKTPFSVKDYDYDLKKKETFYYLRSNGLKILAYESDLTDHRV